MKPSNEFNYLQVEGKPIWYHLASLFSRDVKIYFFLDKKLKGQPKLDGVSINIKLPIKKIIEQITATEKPDKLIIVDDSIVFNKIVANEITSINSTSILFSPASSIDKFSLCGIINNGVVENITYGINRQETNILQFSNIYVLTNPILSLFISKYKQPYYQNCLLFEMCNSIVSENYNITAISKESYKLLSIRNNGDLDQVRKIISENYSSN